MKNPTFGNPPVTEVVLGVFLTPNTQITNAHFGKYWEKQTEYWKSARDQPPIPIRLEQFDDTPAFGTLGFQISSDPSCRIQLYNADQSRLLQLQREGFFFNWRKTENETYPRFESLYDEFHRHFSNYSEFIKSETSEDLLAIQWEVTYVNSIPKGDLWKTLSDWQHIIQGPFGFPPSNLEIDVESTVSNWSYVIGDNLGRFRVSVSHEHQNPDNLIVNLSAKGPLKGDLRGEIEIGHSTIVNYFKELTTDRAHKFWQLETDEQ